MLAAGVVLTTTADFHHTRFLRVFAVFTTVLAAFFARTIACRVDTFVIVVLCHFRTPWSANWNLCRLS